MIAHNWGKKKKTHFQAALKKEGKKKQHQPVTLHLVYYWATAAAVL